MKTCFAFAATVVALIPSAGAGPLNPNIPSISANIKIGKTVEVTRLDEPVFRNVICNFAITPASSTPPSFILAGKVVSNNSGGTQEFVPIFFGSTLHPPRLAALSNADGEFCFRVWIYDKPTQKLAVKPGKTIFSSHEKPGSMLGAIPIRDILRATTLREATLYLEGKFDTNAEMVSSYTHIHSLGEFLKHSAKRKPEDGAIAR